MLCLIYFFLIDQRPPRSTRTGTLVPDTKLFRSPSGPLCGTGRDGSPAVGSAGRQPAGDYGRRRVPGRLKERDAMLLAINANNTNTKFGVIDGDRIVGEWRKHTSAMRTGDEHAVWLLQLLAMDKIDPKTLTGAIIASVVQQAALNLPRLSHHTFSRTTM